MARENEKSKICIILVMASYLKNWRKCHSEALAMADSSDEECSVSANQDDFGSESGDPLSAKNLPQTMCDSDSPNRMSDDGSDEILSDQSLRYGYLTEEDEVDVNGMEVALRKDKI
eukprot:gene10449-11543_t